MNFRPSDEGLRLWDTWFYDHDGDAHLFYLCNPTAEQGRPWRPWDSIGHAVSLDLLNWREEPRIPLRSETPGAWDAGVCLTGNIFRLGGRFAMTYGVVDGDVQKIGLIVSDNLRDWEKLESNPVLVAAPPYEAALNETVSSGVDFRDASVYPLDGGGCEALFCARLASGPHHARGVVGRALSEDGVRWRMAPPLLRTGRTNVAEVPSRFCRDGRHILLFCTNMHLESRLCSARYPDLSWVTYYAVSSRPDGGYRFSRDNILAPGDSTVGRIAEFGGSALFLHHIVSARPALALPKAVDLLPDGRIQLRPWRGVETLYAGAAVDGTSLQLPPEKNGICLGNLAVDEAFATLTANRGVAAAFASPARKDFRVSLDLEWKDADRAGLLLREHDGGAIGMVLDRGARELGIGSARRKAFGQWGFDVRHRYRLKGGEMQRIEILADVRSEGVDWFLDGALIYTTVHEDRVAPGRVGIFAGSGIVRAGDLRIIPLRSER